MNCRMKKVKKMKKVPMFKFPVHGTFQARCLVCCTPDQAVGFEPWPAGSLRCGPGQHILLYEVNI